MVCSTKKPSSPPPPGIYLTNCPTLQIPVLMDMKEKRKANTFLIVMTGIPPRPDDGTTILLLLGA